MKRSAFLIFRISIPLLCLISVGMCFFIGVDTGLSEKDLKQISDTLSADSRTGKKVYDSSGVANYVLSAAKDNSLSAAEMIGIHNKSEGYTSDSSDKSNDISEGIIKAVNDCFYPIIITASAAMILMITAGIISVFRPRKVITALISIASVLAFGCIITSIILLNTHTIRILNEYPCFSAGSGPASYCAIASSAVTAVLCMIYLILFIIRSGKQKSSLIMLTEDSTASIRLLPPAQNSHESSIPVQTMTGSNEDAAYVKRAPSPAVICRSGDSAGKKVLIPMNRPVMIGRDKALCDIFFDSKKISRSHCKISYYHRKQMFSVTDMSVNGVYTEKGERLLKNYANLIPSGSMIYLSDKEISLSLEII